MAISDKITSITNHLIDDYKALENLGADLTNVDKNIENIKSVAEQIYNNLPKTEYQEGTEINLGKTIKGKLDFDNGVVGIGQSEQDGTPTPDTPIAINSVTGNQDVVVSGKNILGSEIELGGFNDDGTPLSGTSTYRNATPIPIEPNKQYVFSINGTAKNINKYYYDRNMNLISKESNVYPLITTPNNAYYLNIYKGVADGDQKWQIVEGTEANTYTLTYEPYITPTSYQLSLGNNKFYAIGDYADELVYDVDNDKVYKKAYIEERLLRDVGQTGASWNKSGLSTSDYFCGYIDFQFVMKESSYYILSNKLINQLYSVEPNDTECIANNVYTVNIRIKASRLSENSVTGLVNYLQNEGSDIMIYFILNTPTLTEITDETLHAQVKALYNAHSNNGTTIITSNGDLPLVLKVRGLKGE